MSKPCVARVVEILAASLLPILGANSIAHAAQRTFVSTGGNDANGCSLAAPCRGFAKAITVTDSGGELVVLDSGGYGSVTVNKDVSIVSPAGVYAGISVLAATDGVTVTSPATKVVLRGLTINGQGGNHGIRIQAGEVHVESTVISNLGQAGIRIEGGSSVRISSTVSRSNADGLRVVPGAGAMSVLVRDSEFSNNASAGIGVSPNAGGASADVTVERCSVTKNGAGLVVSPGASASATVIVTQSVASENTGAGVSSSGGTATVFVRESTITRNGTGLLQASSGILNACGANLLVANTTPQSGAINTASCLDVAGGSGTVTSVATGSGLTGGPITSSGTINLASTQLLPTVACSANQIPKWSGSTWTCAVDATGAVSGAYVQGGNAFGSSAVLGTTDNQAVDVRVNNARALRIEPNAVSPNLIGGNVANGVAAGVRGATIGGGGVAPGDTDPDFQFEGPHVVTDAYGTIGGGYNNRAGDAAGTTVDRPFATVGGGGFNLASGSYGTVAGGGANTAAGSYASVGGGEQNHADNDHGTVAGGANNAAKALFSTVGGGDTNTAGQSVVVGVASTVGGGAHNSAWGNRSTIGGGDSNSTIGGANYSVVSGGQNNVAGGHHASVGGGFGNGVSGDYATIGGGFSNTSTNLAAVVGGGQDNDATGQWSSIAGGSNSTASGTWSAIAGGTGNTATANASAVGGGNGNQATATNSTVGGGDSNTASAFAATVSGGELNTATGARSAVIGGQSNHAGGQFSTVAGGYQNSANADYSFAAGKGAVIPATAPGAFLWNDASSLPPLTSPPSLVLPNAFLARAAGGVYFAVGYDNTFDSFVGVFLNPGAGSWSSLSDRRVKDDAVDIDPREVLDKLMQVPVRTWRYRTQQEHIRHIGPYAQDFHAAFGVGEDERHISVVDADGVALAAIQGLNAKVEHLLETKDVEIRVLKGELAELRHAVMELMAHASSAHLVAQEP